jgi:hypothetical protein
MTTTLFLSLFLLASSAFTAGITLGMVMERRELCRVVRHRLGL